jgi:hypothetical protein
MPTKSNATTNWKPKRTCDGGDIGGGKSHKSGYGHVGNDISSAIDRASNRTSVSLSGAKTGKRGKGKC